VWPYDLNDDLTLEYAQRKFGEDGLGNPYTDDEISRGLPDDWYYERDANGGRHHVYVYLGSKPPMRSTVHPSYFYRV
jgi:hypothetical protein